MKGIWNLNFTVLQLTQHNYKLKENYSFGLCLLFRCNIAPTLDFYISNTEHLDGANLLQSQYYLFDQYKTQETKVPII